MGSHTRGFPVQSWKQRDFLAEPKDHGREIGAYIRDPDGHLIEMGQSRR